MRDASFNFRISRAEEWNYAFWLVEGTRGVDLTGAELQLVIRPVADHPTLIRRLSSAGDDPEIVIDNAAKGAAHILMTQANVAASLPISPTQGWSQILRAIFPGGTITEYWRGALVVHPGRP